MFKANVDRCKHVVEATTYLEIFSYSVGCAFIAKYRWKLIDGIIGSELEFGRGASVDSR